MQANNPFLKKPKFADILTGLLLIVLYFIRLVCAAAKEIFKWFSVFSSKGIKWADGKIYDLKHEKV